MRLGVLRALLIVVVITVTNFAFSTHGLWGVLYLGSGFFVTIFLTVLDDMEKKEKEKKS